MHIAFANKLTLSLQIYTTLRQTQKHLSDGIFIVEGEKVMKRLLVSNLKIKSLLLTKEWFEFFFDLICKRKENLQIFIADEIELQKIVGFHLHQGIMACAKIPHAILFEEFKMKPKNIFVALDGIANSENMGVIIRNCSAFGVDCVVVGENSCSPYLRRAVRNSIGTVFDLQIFHSNNLYETLNMLKHKFNFKIFAAETNMNSLSISDVKFSENICIIFGSEGYGISKNIIELVDEIIEIPMMNKVGSINVANASAIFLWEIRKSFNK